MLCQTHPHLLLQRAGLPTPTRVVTAHRTSLSTHTNAREGHRFVHRVPAFGLPRDYEVAVLHDSITSISKLNAGPQPIHNQPGPYRKYPLEGLPTTDDRLR